MRRRCFVVWCDHATHALATQSEKAKQKFYNELPGIVSEKLAEMQKRLIDDAANKMLAWFCDAEIDDPSASVPVEDGTVDFSRQPCIGVASEDDPAIGVRRFSIATPDIARTVALQVRRAARRSSRRDGVAPACQSSSAARVGPDPGDWCACVTGAGVAAQPHRRLQQRAVHVYEAGEGAVQPTHAEPVRCCARCCLVAYMHDIETARRRARVFSCSCCDQMLFGVHPVFGVFYHIRVPLLDAAQDELDPDTPFFTQSLCFRRKFHPRPAVVPLTPGSVREHTRRARVLSR